MSIHHEVLVIGTGVAGGTVAAACREAGRDVAIADEREPGGTCALRGCDPKKVLAVAADTVHRARALSVSGVGGDAYLEWDNLIGFKRTFTEPVPEQTRKKYKQLGIEFYPGHASFTGRNEMRIGDTIVGADTIVIAAGAAPRILGIPGEAHLTTSDEFLELEELPSEIVFAGGGYVSFEFAHVAVRAGAHVTILENDPSPLRMFEPSLVDMLMASSRADGMEILTGTPVSAIEPVGAGYAVHTADGGTFTAGMVVHGAGRTPAVEALDPEKGNVEQDKNGILIDEYLRSPTNESVYVAGDANACSAQLTPIARIEAEAVVADLLRKERRKPDYTAVPSVVFTSPPLASTGLTEHAARKQGIAYESYENDTSHWAETARRGRLRSGYKVITEPDGGRILGAHLLGQDAPEAINIFVLAMRHGVPLWELREMPWAYPSGTDTIRYMK